MIRETEEIAGTQNWPSSASHEIRILFSLLIAFWVLSQLPRVERALGSSKLLLGAALATVAINLLFLLMVFLLDSLSQLQGQGSMWPFIRSHGLIPLGIYAITLQSLQAGEAETTFFGIPMKAKYYPMVLVAVFALLNGPAVLPDVAALIMGYLHNRARLDAMLPSDGKLQRWENSPFSFVLGRQLFGGHWVQVGQAGAGLATWGGATLPRHHVIRPNAAPAGPAQGTEFRVFQGSGHRLGS
ncbi:unnamed protein product [Symbiodinium natans]|uniref:Derlin n=1 Tax=Symbiodinium natans TaxID=878477 RepID=A0A812TR78_9DINO|nr:unnamed protein product [Symbiodinium natans]